MRIFLPFEIKGIGGTATFAQKFKAGMEAAGHSVTFDHPGEYDLLFLIVQAPFKYLIEAKRRGKPVIQRLDGVWYWSVVGWRFPLYNLKAAIIRHFFADFTIYQSEYSKTSVRRFLFPKPGERAITIYNGVDTDHFSPTGESEPLREHPGQQVFFTASAFRREDQIVPIFEALREYEKRYTQDFKLYIAGTFSGKAAGIPGRYAGYEKAVFLGKIENRDLPRYERAADVFLFTHQNPPCPNNVIEALACGLPVCGVADGAMPEIVENGKSGELLPAYGSGYWKMRKIDSSAFAENLERIMENLPRYKMNAQQHAEQRFSLIAMLTRYISFLTQKP